MSPRKPLVGPGNLNALRSATTPPISRSAFNRRPRHARNGTFDAQWIFGNCRVGFFDSDSSNDTRTLSGLVVTWSPLSDSGLALGAARLAMAAQSDDKLPLGAAFDVLRSAGHANTDFSNAHPVGRDQIFSLFARWVFPAAGFEAYAEWARFEEPLSLRDFLESPAHSEGYTLGFQWAHPLANERTFRLQSEASYLEPDPSLRIRPVATTTPVAAYRRASRTSAGRLARRSVRARRANGWRAMCSRRGGAWVPTSIEFAGTTECSSNRSCRISNVRT